MLERVTHYCLVLQQLMGHFLGLPMGNSPTSSTHVIRSTATYPGSIVGDLSFWNHEFVHQNLAVVVDDRTTSERFTPSIGFYHLAIHSNCLGVLGWLQLAWLENLLNYRPLIFA